MNYWLNRLFDMVGAGAVGVVLFGKELGINNRWYTGAVILAYAMGKLGDKVLPFVGRPTGLVKLIPRPTPNPERIPHDEALEVPLDLTESVTPNERPPPWPGGRKDSAR